jgi:hypothetical protein
MTRGMTYFGGLLAGALPAWLLLVCLLALWPAPAPAGPTRATEPVTWARWTPTDPASDVRIDHDGFERFLLRFLRPATDGSRRVAYREVDAGARQALEAYLEQLGEVRIEAYNRDEQMAFWINLYNAAVVRLIVEHYPAPSILKLDPGAPMGPFERSLVEVEDVPLSLNDIEHRILRPIFADPRVHFALACGALGCPDLQPMPYNAMDLDRQLSAAAMAYVNDPRCVRIKEGRLLVSSLLRWYQDDFGGSEEAVSHHLMAYAEPELAMQLQQFDQIHGDMFDWRLNDTSD